MSELSEKFKYVILALVFAILAPALAGAEQLGAGGTKILGLRVSIKGSQTRLIFDADGPRPKQVGPASENGISIFFGQITAKMPDRKVTEAASAVRDILFRRESGFLEVLFREKNTSVNYTINPGKKQNRYTMVLELTAARPKGSASNATAAAEAPKEKEKPSPTAEIIKRIETEDLFGSKAPPGLKGLLQAEEKKKGDNGPERSVKSQPFAETDDRTAALYSTADELFESCRRNLVLCGSELIDAYSEALKAGPRSSRAPLALYRMGLAQWSMGNYTKAEKTFRRVISEWPDQPPVSRSLLGLGDIQNKKHAYIEAMESFRAAVRTASDKPDKAAAYFELGREFLLLGASKDALEMFGQCTANDPDYYTVKPELMRLVGEAEFFLGAHDKSREHLLRYLNFQQSAPEQDIVYAKLAEIFLVQGETGLANKIYDFIRKYFTDSEGDIICRVRQAELTERTYEDHSIKAYERLCEKDLSPSLRRVILYKLATLNWKKGSLERSLELMDEALQGRTDVLPGNDMGALRDKVLKDLVKKFFAEKNYLGVVQLHDRFKRVFDLMQQTPEVLEQIAESYAAMRFFSNSIELYDRIFAKSPKKNEEQLLKCAVYSLRMGDYGKSSQFCRQIQSEALDLKKSEVLGHISCRELKHAEAVKYFSKILQKQKEFDLIDPDTYQSYGQSLIELKKFEEAIPILQKGLERLKPDDYDGQRAALVLLANCYSELKQYAKAAEIMEKALRFATDERANELLYETAKLYIAAGQPEKAVQNLNQLVGAQNPFWSAVAEQQINSIQMALMNQSR